MARDESKRLNQTLIEADRVSCAALQTVTGYAPANSAFSLSALNDARDAVAAAQDSEARLNAAAAAARDLAVKKEWEFHNLVLGMRDQVVAQFGRDSDQVQAVGLKKVSEHKRRSRKPQPPQP